MVFLGILACQTVSSLRHGARPAFGAQQTSVHLRRQEIGPYCVYSLEDERRNNYLQKGRKVRMGLGRNSKNGQEKKKADNDLMQDAEKSEGCISTKACTREEQKVQTRLCFRRHPRTKISLLICALQRKGSRWKVREQGPRLFIRLSREKRKANQMLLH